jgi:hypothetical protein
MLSSMALVLLAGAVNMFVGIAIGWTAACRYTRCRRPHGPFIRVPLGSSLYMHADGPIELLEGAFEVAGTLTLNLDQQGTAARVLGEAIKGGAAVKAGSQAGSA